MGKKIVRKKSLFLFMIIKQITLFVDHWKLSSLLARSASTTGIISHICMCARFYSLSFCFFLKRNFEKILKLIN